MQGRALRAVSALGNAGSALAELLVQAVPAGLARRAADAEAAQHPAGALLLHRAELQLRAAQLRVPREAGQAEAAGDVVGGAAVRVLAAHVGQAADVDTLVAHAGPLPRAVRVGDALQLHAPHLHHGTVGYNEMIYWAVAWRNWSWT